MTLYVRVRHDIIAENFHTGRKNCVFEISRYEGDPQPVRCNHKRFRGRIRTHMPRDSGQWSLEIVEEPQARGWVYDWLSDDPMQTFRGVSHLVYKPDAAPNAVVWIEIEFGGKRHAWLEISPQMVRQS